MKILAVEFSSEDRSAAVLESGVGAPILLGKVCEHGGRRAIELVEQALLQAGCEREQIDCMAIGLGPGSYTGIRGAISLAQGWQLGRGIKLLGISSVECMAAQAHAQKLFGSIHIVIDAQRNEFYLARYEITPEGWHEINPLHLVPELEVQQLCESGQTVIGPEIIESFSKAKNMSPDAAMLGHLAASRSDFISGDKIEPIYLRETDFKKAPPRRIIH
jgi:tRNA threonylcarbamoyladenosine biosynthesis protein TsaB